MSARANSIYLTGVTAGADLSGSQYIAVKSDAAGAMVVAGAGGLGWGLLQNNPVSGQAASVVAMGGALGIAAGNIDEGAFVKSDASGHLIATTTEDDFYIGRAVRSAVDNDIFEVFVNPGYHGA